jgi:hypothetical protein
MRLLPSAGDVKSSTQHGSIDPKASDPLLSSLVRTGTLGAGRMAERTKATVLKTVSGATRSWVRIPLLPLMWTLPDPTVDR